MENILFLTFTYFAESLVFYFYCKSLYQPKKNSKLSFALTVTLYFVMMLVFKFVVNIETVNAIMTIVTNIAIILIAFNSSIKSSVFHSIVMCILRYISEFISIYLLAITYTTSSNDIIKNYFEMASLMSNIICFLLSRIAVKLSVKETQAKSWGKWALLSLLPICSIVIILVFRMLTGGNILSVKQNLICISSIAFLFIVNIIVYAIYEQAEKTNQKLIELELTNQKNEIDMQYLELLEKKNDDMNIMTHDYKNNVLAIADMTNSTEIKSYINEMVGEISKYNKIAKTKNKMLDIIINKYTDICADKNITFKTNILSENLSFMNDYDISSLFNNILDNSVEAAVNSNKKDIGLEITNAINSYHKIIVTNSCDTPPHSKNDKLITTKKNKESHGFGTKSIQNIADKYNGEMRWEYSEENKQFKLTILIPYKQ